MFNSYYIFLYSIFLFCILFVKNILFISNNNFCIILNNIMKSLHQLLCNSCIIDYLIVLPSTIINELYYF